MNSILNGINKQDVSLNTNQDDFAKSQYTYIRWDFLAHVLNTSIMEKTQGGDSPLIYFKTDTIVNEDKPIIKTTNKDTSISGKHIEPLAYTSQRLSKDLKKEFKDLYSLSLGDARNVGWFGTSNPEKWKEWYGNDGAEQVNDRLDNLKHLNIGTILK